MRLLKKRAKASDSDCPAIRLQREALSAVQVQDLTTVYGLWAPGVIYKAVMTASSPASSSHGPRWLDLLLANNRAANGAEPAIALPADLSLTHSHTHINTHTESGLVYIQSQWRKAPAVCLFVKRRPAGSADVGLRVHDDSV